MVRPEKSVAQLRPQKGRVALMALAWIVLTSLTLISVAYSVRIYFFLISDEEGTDNDGGSTNGGGGGGIRGGDGPAGASSRQMAAGGGGTTKQEGNTNDEPNYALLYPEPDCVGPPIQIPYSSSKEKNCEHCRDFCQLHFSDREPTANLARYASVFVHGDRGAEIAASCIGTFNYDKYSTLKVIRPGDGCVGVHGAAHIKFV